MSTPVIDQPIGIGQHLDSLPMPEVLEDTHHVDDVGTFLAYCAHQPVADDKLAHQVAPVKLVLPSSHQGLAGCQAVSERERVRIPVDQIKTDDPVLISLSFDALKASASPRRAPQCWPAGSAQSAGR